MLICNYHLEVLVCLRYSSVSHCLMAGVQCDLEFMKVDGEVDGRESGFWQMLLLASQRRVMFSDYNFHIINPLCERV